jgi:predicted cation transporter
MTSYQRAKRIYLWRGSAIVLLGTTFAMLASAYVGQLTS